MKDILLSILLGYVTKVYGVSEEEASELLFKKTEGGELDKESLNDDVLKTLLSKDKERVKTIKEEVDTTEAFQKGFDDAKAKVLAKVEKKIIKDHGDEFKGLKLDEMVAKLAEGASPSGQPKPDDEVKKHPLYLALEKSKADEIKSLTTTHEQAIKDLETKQAKSETLGTVNGLILSLFESLKPILPKDAAKATNAKNDFVAKFADYDYQPKEGGGYLILKDGKRVEDDHGNPLTLEAMVSEKANAFYEFKVQDQKGSAGNGGDGSGAGGSSIEVPSSQEEYEKAIFNATTSEERIAIADAYEAANASD